MADDKAPEMIEADPAARPVVSPSWQTAARFALATALVLVGIWILHEFLPALAWAVVLAIALWPSYTRLLRLLPAGGDRALAPLLATAAIGSPSSPPLCWCRSPWPATTTSAS